jgi:hypothetical protein
MRTLGRLALAVTVPLSALLASGCSSAPEIKPPVAFKTSRAPASVSAAVPGMNWQCMQASKLSGQWEIRIQDLEAHFIYQPNFLPGTEPTDVELQEPKAVQVGKKFQFSSDQLDLTVKTNKKASLCPLEGETCFQAKLARVDVEALGAEVAQELVAAKWSCAPRER